jgi:hypothetical protein
MSGLTRDVAVQLDRAYRAMAQRARYRPAAPSDGFGHINGPLHLGRESRDYAFSWWAEEDSLRFFIGCCTFETCPATVYAIEAARAMCGADARLARRLLQLAIDELDEEGTAVT